MIRPTLAYEVVVWHTTSPVEEEVWHPKSLIIGLEKVQNKCLRIIIEIYRATLIIVIEMEAYTPPLNVHLDVRVAGFRKRHKDINIEKVVIKTYHKIH